PFFIEYISSVALHAAIDDSAVAKRIADEWEPATRYPDIPFFRKHQVASMMGDYLVRHKNRLDAENPLFKERSREPEALVRAVTHGVNVPAGAADRARLAAARRAAARLPRSLPRTGQ